MKETDIDTMQDQWLKMWDNRYKQQVYVYGEEPNNYFKEQLSNIKPGKILLGAEGEGRNAVFAAKLGWQVSAFDISHEGKKKALELAKENDVNIDYRVGSFPELGFELDHYDAIALIYAHFPPSLRKDYYQLLDNCLKSKGHVIFEAFGKSHLPYRSKNPKVGGPQDIESLYSIEDLELCFPNYKSIELAEKEIELSEGIYHNGVGSVTRFHGVKM
ncbi:class I SAM-dependent methyltransferase [Reichenbachiella versicolor]|uniref:class I SAM-dependent methyltransferase n=1 Tax=Reichenbachiella versicolor TaxID=1821036 RepID=UPI0029372608|nr:class I SAM-dependent methyltransferase [Reichenbachiella versicolor]